MAAVECTRPGRARTCRADLADYDVHLTMGLRIEHAMDRTRTAPYIGWRFASATRPSTRAVLSRISGSARRMNVPIRLSGP